MRTAEMKKSPSPRRGNSLPGLGGCFWGTGLKARCGRRARPGSAASCSPGTADTCPGTASASRRCRRRPLRTAEMKKSPSPRREKSLAGLGDAFWNQLRARRSRRARRGSAGFCSPGMAGTCPGTASASPRCRRRRRRPLRTAEMKKSPSPRREKSLAGLGDAFWDRLRVRCGRAARGRASPRPCIPGRCRWARRARSA